MNQAVVASRMSQCDITNGYEGLEDLEQLASSEPESAWQIIWTVLTREADPGKDDGAMCLELLRIAVSCLGRPTVEEHLIGAWDRLPSEIRHNLIHGVAKADVISPDTAVLFFDHPSNTVHERHLICATMIAGRNDKSPQTILNMAQRIGAYEDADRQAQLEAFVDSIVANYK